MNCEKWQHKLLLAESGELPEDDRADLEAHLAGCRTCREFPDASAALAAAVRPLLRRDAPSPAAIASICEAAAAATRRPLLLRPLVLRFAAAAAALVVAAGGWLFLRPDAEQHADGIHHVGLIVTMVSEQHADGANVPAASASDNDTRLKALARELLRMEGLATDEVL
jgi:predicted anti-sigma-YlaC factor YlaD